MSKAKSIFDACTKYVINFICLYSDDCGAAALVIDVDCPKAASACLAHPADTNISLRPEH
jgi:hypothetical protein